MVISCNWTSGLGHQWHQLGILGIIITAQKLLFLQCHKLAERHSVLWRVFLPRMYAVRSQLCRLGILINGVGFPSLSAVFNGREYLGKWQAVGMFSGRVVQYLCWRFGEYCLFLLLEPEVPAYYLRSVQCILGFFLLSMTSSEAFIYFKGNGRALYSICSIH